MDQKIKSQIMFDNGKTQISMLQCFKQRFSEGRKQNKPSMRVCITTAS